jgi:VanZ family protein
MFPPVKWLLRIDTRWWLAAFWLVWCAATILMLLPAQDLPQVNIWDKAEHSGTFFALMTLASLAYFQKHSLQRLAILLITYGIAIECIQFFIPSRSFSVLDMVADSIGVLPAWWLAVQLERS